MREISVLLKSSMVTDIHLKSTAQLNLNITESCFEVCCDSTFSSIFKWLSALSILFLSTFVLGFIAFHYFHAKGEL